MSLFKLTEKQKEAQKVFASDATHICLYGGSRSGKTFLTIRNIVMRSLKAKSSRHGIFRFRFNAVKASIMQDTLPKVLKTAFNGVDYQLNKTDCVFTFENGSEIWLGGLDDKERAEKVLGMEFATIYLNECSQIPYASRNLVLTRLAQKCEQQIEGAPVSILKPRVYYDLNPTTKGHWTYKIFVDNVDPDTKEVLKKPQDYALFKINPVDNIENLNKEYLATLDSLPARDRARFVSGDYGEDNPNALFTSVIIDTWRVIDGVVPQLIRIVVAVDPSGADDDDNAGNDAIGIVVVGLGIDGNAYVLEDCTVKASPKVWGSVAVSAYDRHKANVIVAEKNFGGAMVKYIIQTSKPGVPYKDVNASRGKSVRAEPISALYEQGKVRHVGKFRELEDELCDFSTMGYTGKGSPNRADALVWAITELFPWLSTSREEKTVIDYSQLDMSII